MQLEAKLNFAIRYVPKKILGTRRRNTIFQSRVLPGKNQCGVGESLAVLSQRSRLLQNLSHSSRKLSGHLLIPKLHLGMQLYKSYTLIISSLLFDVHYLLRTFFKMKFFFQLCSQMEFGNKKKLIARIISSE